MQDYRRVGIVAALIVAVLIAMLVPFALRSDALSAPDAVPTGSHRFRYDFGTLGSGFAFIDGGAQFAEGVLLVESLDGDELLRRTITPAPFGSRSDGFLDLPIPEGVTQVYLRLVDYPVAGARTARDGPWLLEDGGESDVSAILFTFGVGCASRTLVLRDGFNLVGWPGADGAEIADTAQPSVGGPIFTELFGWEPLFQRYQSWSLDLPPFVNDIATFSYGRGYWVFAPASGTLWPQGLSDEVWQERSVDLNLDWNLIMWSGPDNTDPWVAFGPDAFNVFSIAQSPFRSAFTFDNDTRTFLGFDDDLPDALNTMPPLNFGDAVWLQTFGGILTIPAPGVDDPCDP